MEDGCLFKCKVLRMFCLLFCEIGESFDANVFVLYTKP